MDKGDISSRELGKHNTKTPGAIVKKRAETQSGYGEYALNNKHIEIDPSHMAGNVQSSVSSSVSNKVQNQNQGHNAKKEALGPNTNR